MPVYRQKACSPSPGLEDARSVSEGLKFSPRRIASPSNYQKCAAASLVPHNPRVFLGYNSSPIVFAVNSDSGGRFFRRDRRNL